MAVERYLEILAEIDRLRAKVEEMIWQEEKAAASLGQADTSSRGQPGSPENGPSDYVEEVLEVIRRRISSEKARESGYTLLFALIEAREGRERSSTLACMSESELGEVLVPDPELTAFAAVFTSPGRLKIIRALAHGSRTSRELSAQTGLVGGQLYHHLNELIHAGFVRQAGRNCYFLTEEVGKPAYLGMNLLARTLRHARNRLRQKEEGYSEHPEGPDSPDEGDAGNL